VPVSHRTRPRAPHPGEPELLAMTHDRVLWIMTWLLIAGAAVTVVVLKLT
jgi:hypothetical protein